MVVKKAKILTDKCKRCYKCVSRCPHDAIYMGENGYPKINEKLCTGCGVCAKVRGSCIELSEVNQDCKLPAVQVPVFISTITDTLAKYLDFEERNSIVVAFSGGVDSMALLNALVFAKNNSVCPNLRICAAHLNHGWRGLSSDNDEAACRAVCEKLGVEFYTEKLSDDIPKTETAAREERYKFYSRAAKFFNSNIVLTAHNQSDNAETVLYRITKGTGVKGLCGIGETRLIGSLLIIRPMLNLSRSQIELYCQENSLNPNIDKSNFDTEYNRNYIRHEVLPKLSRINAKVEQAISNLSGIAKADELIILEYLSKLRKKIYVNNKFITKDFIALSHFVKMRLIYDYICDLREMQEFDYDSKKISEIYDFIESAANSKSGKTHSLSTNLLLYVSSKHIYAIEPSTDRTKDITFLTDEEKEYIFDNKKFSISTNTANIGVFPSETANEAFVRLDNIEGLSLRYRKPGDIIQPFGMNSTIKLKKYFINKGIAQHEKDKIVLLCKDNEVLWAIGVGLSEKLRVDAIPTHVLKIEGV